MNKIVFGLYFLTIFTIHAWPPTLKNCGNTCFLNATLQAMYNINPLTDIFLKTQNPYNKDTAPVGYYYVQLIKQAENPLYSVLFTCDSVLGTLDKSAYNLMGMEACSQQDATEFLGKFLDTLIEHGDPLKDAIKKLFNFDSLSTIICPALPSSTDPAEQPELKSQKIEDYTYLSVQTQDNEKKPLKSLKQCLEEYFKVEKLDDPNNAYKDERTSKYRIDCTKQLQISNSPEIFIIGLKRYELDLFGNAKKLDHRIYIPLQLNVSDFVKETQNPLANHFELIAVIVQSGGIAGGHYWAYVKYETGQWFSCNDTNISKVSITDSSVLKNIEGGPGAATGYGFVYQKKTITQDQFKKWQQEEQQQENKALGIGPLDSLKRDLENLTESLQKLRSSL